MYVTRRSFHFCVWNNSCLTLSQTLSILSYRIHWALCSCHSRLSGRDSQPCTEPSWLEVSLPVTERLWEVIRHCRWLEFRLKRHADHGLHGELTDGCLLFQSGSWYTGCTLCEYEVSERRLKSPCPTQKSPTNRKVNGVRCRIRFRCIRRFKRELCYICTRAQRLAGSKPFDCAPWRLSYPLRCYEHSWWQKVFNLIQSHCLLTFKSWIANKKGKNCIAQITIIQYDDCYCVMCDELLFRIHFGWFAANRFWDYLIPFLSYSRELTSLFLDANNYM